MPTPALTTRLDAVNVILSSSGENPVPALSTSTADTANAEAILDEVSREVQSLGWSFNTERKVLLAPTVAGLIELPPSVLHVDLDPDNPSDVEPVQRGSQLYDAKNHTNVFTRPILAEVIYFLEFEQLPEQARRYIAVRAARTFFDRFIGAESQRRFSREDEERALAALTKLNLRAADRNIFRSNPSFAWQLARR